MTATSGMISTVPEPWMPEGRPPSAVELSDRYGPCLSAAEIAEVAGITAKTWRWYVHMGEARAPKPDRVLGRTPVWLAETVATWLAQRPGSGRFRSEEE